MARRRGSRGTPTTGFASWSGSRGWRRLASEQTAELFGHSEPFSGTWPTSGTTLGGVAFRLPEWVPPTAGSGFSSSPGPELLPTPNTGESPNGHGRRGGKAGNGRQSGSSLEAIAPLLPTPNATPLASSLDLQCSGDGRETPNKLGWAVAEMTADPLLKTPTAQLAVNGGSQHPSKRREGGHGPTLADEAEHLLPTPQARDPKGAGMHAGGNPTLGKAVEELLPTPTADDAKSPMWYPGGNPTLLNVLKTDGPVLLPTPRAQNAEDRNPTVWQRPDGEPVNLENALALLPTPVAHDDGKSPEAHAAMKAKMGGNRTVATSLAVVARNGMDPLLPTPTRADHDRGSETYGRGNPTLKGALNGTRRNGRTPKPADGQMDLFSSGDPTNPQSGDGNT